MYSVDVISAAGVDFLNYEIDIFYNNFLFPDLRSDDIGIV
jgi:hypothetical protein